MSHGGNMRTIDLLFFEFLRIYSSIQHLIRKAKIIVKKMNEILNDMFRVLISANNVSVISEISLSINFDISFMFLFDNSSWRRYFWFLIEYLSEFGISKVVEKTRAVISSTRLYESFKMGEGSPMRS